MDKKTKTNNNKIIIIIVVLIVSVIILFTSLSFIPEMGDTMLFDDVDVIDLSEIIIFYTILIGTSLILILFMFRKVKK